MDLCEQTLVDQAIAGDRKAMERLLVLHGRRLSEYLAPRMPAALSGILDAEDILQQTFLQAYRDISGFKPRHQGSFYAWLRGIADNRLLDCIREQRRKKRGGEFRRTELALGQSDASALDILNTLCAPIGTPSQSLGLREAEDLLKTALEHLPDDQREAVQRHCLQGESLQDTAIAMGKTSGAIRALVHRGKAKLLDILSRSDIWMRSD